MTPATFITQLTFFLRKSIANTDALNLFNLIDQDVQSRADWYWLEEATQLTVADASLTDLPADFRKAWEVKVDGEVYRPVDYLDRARYTAGSNPRKYYLFGEKIAFPGYQNTGASDNVDLSYLKLVSKLTDVNNPSLAPSSFDPAYVEFGVGYLWQREGNYGKAGNHLAAAEQIINTLKAENHKRIKGRTGVVRHIEEFYPRTY